VLTAGNLRSAGQCDPHQSVQADVIRFRRYDCVLSIPAAD
jgi:hypothetical protein